MALSLDRTRSAEVGRYLITARGEDPITVEAPHWLGALGDGLTLLAQLDGLDRLACEVLRNGTVIARDVRNGNAYVVKPMRPIARGDDPDSSLELTDPPLPEPGALAADDSAVSLPERIALTLVDTIRGAPTAGVAWQLALEIAQELIPSDAGAGVARLTDGRIRFVGAVGPAAHQVRGVVLPRGAGFAGHCIERVVPVLITDAVKDRRFFPAMDALTGYRTEQVMCVPVALEGTTFGCLQLSNPVAGTYLRSQLGTLELVAAALADRLRAEVA